MKNQDQSPEINNQETEKMITADLAHLYNYPTIGKLFTEPNSQNLQNLRSKLNSTKERLDLIIRKGSNEEANGAAKALEAIGVTLTFLEELELKQQSSES